MNGISSIFRLIVVLAALWTASNLYSAESVVTSAMTGHWEGNARIIVSWCHQTNLLVAVDIHADGSVTGKIGDATLVGGRFELNRGWLGRKLNLYSDYLIKGKLNGPIVATEGITRDGIFIPLNFTDGTLVGGINTTGQAFGGKDRMALSAESLKLIQTK